MTIIPCHLNYTAIKPNEFANPIIVPPHAREELAIVKQLGGGCFHTELQEIVPNHPSLVDRVFNCTRKYFNRAIGNIYPTWVKLGLNTAKDPHTLRKDVAKAAPQFIRGARQIAKEFGARLSNNQSTILKSEGSLKRKIIRYCKERGMSIEEGTAKVGDALRTTIFIDSPEQIQPVYKAVNKWIEKMDGEIVWENIFDQERELGYVGVHGNILFPFMNHKGEERQIRCELKIGFPSISEGPESPLERVHSIYKGENQLIPNGSIIARAASKLSFLSGMASIGNICRMPQYLMSICSTNGSPPSQDLCQDSDFNNICEGNLGKTRLEMPQLSGSDFLRKKEAQGIRVERRSIPASELTPVQRELNREKVAGLVASIGQKPTYNPCKKAIVVASSQDKDGKNYVIDGHHRYAACRLVGGDQEIIAVHDRVENILSELERSSDVKHSSLAQATTKHK